jgi:hypothetical protein
LLQFLLGHQPLQNGRSSQDSIFRLFLYGSV